MRVSQAATLMRGRAEGSLPVFSGPRLVGIVILRQRGQPAWSATGPYFLLPLVG
jgi:hypothetical protein